MTTNAADNNATRSIARDAIRSRLVLEVASEMIEQEDWPNRQARVSLRPQGAAEWAVNMIASDGPGALDLVARGEMQLAISNPAMYLALAVRGTGPYKKPIPLRAITIIPSPDQLAFAVTEKTGVKSLHEIRERRMPLRVSVRGQRDHALHPITDEVLNAAGFTLDDIASWGGQVRYDDGLPIKSNRFGAMQRGEVDMIIDEAVRGWANPALDAGMRILPLDDEILTQMEDARPETRGHAGCALSQVGQGSADIGFQRFRCLHPCRCAGQSDRVGLRCVGSAQGAHRLAGTGTAAA